jgi:hypothetical protein
VRPSCAASGSSSSHEPCAISPLASHRSEPASPRLSPLAIIGSCDS